VERGENETLGCETFLHRDDSALYAAKARGRNRVETAAPSLAVGQEF
jgi:GGDEF domain-containing protein